MDNTEPIGRFGSAWQRFMKENYPDVVTDDLTGDKFDVLARKIDAEAWEMWELLRRQYAEKYPRPKIFTEIVVWEKTRSLYVEHEVMEQVAKEQRASSAKQKTG